MNRVQKAHESFNQLDERLRVLQGALSYLKGSSLNILLYGAKKDYKQAAMGYVDALECGLPLLRKDIERLIKDVNAIPGSKV